MAERDIFITDEDHRKLSSLLESSGRRDREHVEQLAAELERASVVPPEQVPPDVVTMDSQVALRDLDTGDERVITVVYPHDADVDQQKVSVLAPLGTAVLGYRAGDVIEWTMPAGTRRLKVERILYQPEAELNKGSSS